MKAVALRHRLSEIVRCSALETVNTHSARHKISASSGYWSRLGGKPRSQIIKSDKPSHFLQIFWPRRIPVEHHPKFCTVRHATSDTYVGPVMSPRDVSPVWARSSAFGWAQLNAVPRGESDHLQLPSLASRFPNPRPKASRISRRTDCKSIQLTRNPKSVANTCACCECGLCLGYSTPSVSPGNRFTRFCSQSSRSLAASLC